MIDGEMCAVGAVITSSKDQIDKVFMGKLFYNKDIPHFAILLISVQCRGKERCRNYCMKHSIRIF